MITENSHQFEIEIDRDSIEYSIEAARISKKPHLGGLEEKVVQQKKSKQIEDIADDHFLYDRKLYETKPSVPYEAVHWLDRLKSDFKKTAVKSGYEKEIKNYWYTKYRTVGQNLRNGEIKMVNKTEDWVYCENGAELSIESYVPKEDDGCILIMQPHQKL